MQIYFKFLDNCFLIDNELDNICGDTPCHFVEFIDKLIPADKFIKIRHENKDYYIHYSNLQRIN